MLLTECIHVGLSAQEVSQGLHRWLTASRLEDHASVHSALRVETVVK